MVDSIIGRWESSPARKSCHKVYPLLPNGKSMYRPQKDCIDYNCVLYHLLLHMDVYFAVHQSPMNTLFFTLKKNKLMRKKMACCAYYLHDDIIILRSSSGRDEKYYLLLASTPQSFFFFFVVITYYCVLSHLKELVYDTCNILKQVLAFFKTRLCVCLEWRIIRAIKKVKKGVKRFSLPLLSLVSIAQS